jgi:hypothetical protein
MTIPNEVTVKTLIFLLFEFIIPTNLDIKDAACLHVVHFLQYPTSRPTTWSTQDTMDNTPKENLAPLPVGKYGKSIKHFTQRRHQVNKGKSGLAAYRASGLGSLRSLRSKKKLPVGKRSETYNFSTEERENWIGNYVE